jgi:AcrR family transcriptional regulator
MATRGRRPGSGDTRQEILDAARKTFAEVGFDRARLRLIADEAGVDPSLIVHFFGSKRELYERAIAAPPAHVAATAALPSDLHELAERAVVEVLTYLDRMDVRSAFVAEIRSASDLAETCAIFDRYVFLPVNAYLFDRDDSVGADLRYALVRAQFRGLVSMRYVSPVEPVASASVEEVAREYAKAIVPLIAAAQSAQTSSGENETVLVR